MSLVHRILAPTDFSEASAAALRYAWSLASPLNATVELLHVFHPPPLVDADLLIQTPGASQMSVSTWMKVEAAKSMDRFLSESSKDERPLTHLREGDTAKTIVQFAKRERFDLIVLGTHGRSGLKGWVIGSVAERVVRTAHCPVLTVRAEDSGLL